MNDLHPLRVCYFGTYRQDYARNQIMLKGLRRNGVAVVECHATLWASIAERVASVQGGWRRPSFWWKILRTYGQLLQQYRKIAQEYDILIVGYPGQFDVFLARILSWWAGKPLVWDIFMSIYLIASERGLKNDHALSVNLIRFWEGIACRLPDLLILDTDAYVKWFVAQYHIAENRFRLVPTGADSDRFTETLAVETDLGKPFTVLYYGTFIPNHGVDTIIQAAKLLREEPAIQFVLIGEGPTRQPALEQCRLYGLKNVAFVGWLEYAQLIQQIAQASICLGAFGHTPQSLMTIQNKIYEGLAMRKLVLSGDSSAVRQAFRHGEHLILCDRTPTALATAIRTLYSDQTKLAQIAEQGHELFMAQFTIEKLGLLYRNHIEPLVD